MANQEKKEKLFDEFPPISTQDWENKIIADLKGADYKKKLIWQTPEGIEVAPYYREEHLWNIRYLDSLPGQFPFTRGSNKHHNNWEIRQDLDINNIKSANKKALSVLNKGVTSLGFNDAKETGKGVIKSQADLFALLENIHIDCIDINFFAGYNCPDILEWLKTEAEKRNIDSKQLKGSVNLDPLGHLTITGNWNRSENEDFNDLIKIVTLSKDMTSYRSVSVNGVLFNNAGASIVQELAYSLSIASEYFDRLTDAGFAVSDIAHLVQFNLGTGTNYFMEIAKLRAARTLWSKILEAYNLDHHKCGKLFIHSVTSSYWQTIYDPYINVLRATTESMSAILGGTNSLSVLGFDSAYNVSNDFSDRIARNIQIILKEESYFDKIVDPSSGSYYIENLTDSIITESWKLFLEIEKQGGYLNALKMGIIQQHVKESCNEHKKKIAGRREVLLGTNQFPNNTETVNEHINHEIAFSEIKIKDTIIEPVQKLRGAWEFEKLRLATEKHSRRPMVFLLTIGNLTMRKARATFASNFFATAGYEIIDNPGFVSTDQACEIALKANPDIVVICSSDEEYEKTAPDIYHKLKDNTLVVVAGAPACMNELKEKGIKHFIHIKTNALESLQSFHKELGIDF